MRGSFSCAMARYRSRTAGTGQRRGLTVTVNVAVAVLPLASVAAQPTVVLPSLKRLPDLGQHETGRSPPSSSVAVTLKVTRALFAPFAARTVFATAPVSLGSLKSSPGAVRVPVQVSTPKTAPGSSNEPSPPDNRDPTCSTPDERPFPGGRGERACATGDRELLRLVRRPDK